MQRSVLFLGLARPPKFLGLPVGYLVALSLGVALTNATLRDRLGIDPHNASQDSVIIRQALDAGLVRPADPEHPRAGYVPFWA